MTTQENTPNAVCTITRSSLLPVLVHAAKVAIRDQDRPAFAHVRIAAGGGFLTVTASDGDLVLTTTLAAPGDLAPRLVNLRALTDAVRAVVGDLVLTAGTVSNHHHIGPTLTVTADGAAFTLNARKEDDIIGKVPDVIASQFAIDSVALPRLLARVAYCLPGDDNRYGLNGMAVELTPGRVRMVATDGNRLSWCEADIVGEGVPMPRHMFPSKAVRVLAAHGGAAAFGFGVVPVPDFTRADGTVLKHPGIGRFEVRGPSWTLTGRLIDADFPDYRQVVPKAHKRVVIVDRATLAKALRRLLPFAPTPDGTTRCVFGDGAAGLSATTSDRGTASATVPIGFTGEPITIGLNVRFVLAVLAPLPDGPIEMSMGDVSSPVVIVSLVDKSSTHIVMPIRLD